MPFAKILLATKLLSVCTFASGAVATSFATNYEDRKRAAYFWGGPGFGLCWALGLGLTSVNGVTVFSTWILGTIAASLVTLNGMMFLAGRPERGSWKSRTITLAPIALCILLMVFRPE